MPEPKRNQRKHARVQPKAMSSRVRIGGALHIGLGVDNLSLGGAFIRCAQTPPLKSQVVLELAVPGVEQALVLPGRVAFTVNVADAATRKVSPGFAIEFTQPLAPHLEKGLERLVRAVDPRAVAPLPRMSAAPAVVEAPPTEDQEALAALRLRFASQERELMRLRRENEELKARLERLLTAGRR